MKFPVTVLTVLVASSSAFAPFKPISQHSMSSSVTTRPSISPSSKIYALPPMLDGAIVSASAASATVTSSPLFEYFLQTVISYAVPTFFTLVTIFFAASAFRKRESVDFSSVNPETAIAELYSDLYGETKPQRGGFALGGRLNKAQRRNLGIPESEFLKITNLNERYDSYDFSLRKATKSKAYAASKYRSRSFDRALAVALAGDEMPVYAKSMLLEAEKNFLTTAKVLISEIQTLETRLAGATIDEELKRIGMKQFKVEPEDVIDAQVESSNTTLAANTTEGFSKFTFWKKDGKSELLQSISKLQRELKQAELNFLQDVVAAVGTKRGLGIRAALLGDVAARGSAGLFNQLEERPLSAILSSSDTEEAKSLFVMRFPGDVQASQLNQLREEVTAIIRNSKPGDEAMVVLQSGGGTVTGYGLAAGQLVRLKEAGLFLTMAVEQVAASGGYMMACVADRIVASPFAVLGSIGVISEIPNVYERLKQEGM
jgi:Peptidase family S49 N-terminal/Peptidase family S49